MRSKVLMIAIVAVCMCSMGSAEKMPGKTFAQEGPGNGERINGVMGPLTVTLTQVGALVGRVNVSFNTTGAYSPYYPEDAFFFVGQIYDYPWRSSYNGTTYVNTNDFVSTGITIVQADYSGAYSQNFSFTVPITDVYQAWGLVYGGWYPGLPWLTGPPYDTGFWWSQYQLASGNTLLIDARVPEGGMPIPTLNWLGILAMVAMIAGGAMFLVIRRR
ncbi:MAG: hypothetical protein K8R59_06375 [Thermoanaerobaculales bacterium]|nr:hypothetical protein [Thermoanaerobaculales bacterium]